MKNVCLSLVLGILLCMPIFSLANVNRVPSAPDSSLAMLFQLDEETVYQTVSELTALESYLAEHQGTSLNQLQATENPIIQDIQFSSDPYFNLVEPPLGIPSFVWGFCLGLIGMLVVYLVTEEKEEVLKSLYGCLISTIIGTVINVIVMLNQ